MNNSRRITATALLALLVFCIWSSASRSAEERSVRRVPDQTSSARQNLPERSGSTTPESPGQPITPALPSPQTKPGSMGREEKLVRDVYARLMRYQSAARDVLDSSNGGSSNPEDYVTFYLRRIHTGPISEIYSKPLAEVVTSRNGDVLNVQPNYLSADGGPAHAYYEVAWITVPGRNGAAENTVAKGFSEPTVGQMLNQGGERLANVAKYTSYEVSVLLSGKQRTYRALILHHVSSAAGIKTNQPAKGTKSSAARVTAEILDQITADMNTVYNDESPRVRAPWDKYVNSATYRAMAKTIKEKKKAGKPLRTSEDPIGYMPIEGGGGGDDGGGGGGGGEEDPPIDPPVDPCALARIRITSPNAVSQNNPKGYVDGTTQKGMLGATVPLRAEVTGAPTGGTYQWKIGNNVVGTAVNLDAVITSLGSHSVTVKYDKDSANVHLVTSFTLNEVVPEVNESSSGESAFIGTQFPPFVRQGHNCMVAVFNPAWYLTTACTYQTAIPGMEIEAFIKDPRPYISNPDESKLKLVQIVNDVLKRTHVNTGTCETLKVNGWMLDLSDPYSDANATGDLRITSGPSVKMIDSPNAQLSSNYHINLNESFEVYLVYFTGTVQQPQNQKAIAVLPWSWGGATQYNASSDSHSSVSGSLFPANQKTSNGEKLTPSNNGTGIRTYDATPIQNIDPNNPANWKPCT